VTRPGCLGKRGKVNVLPSYALKKGTKGARDQTLPISGSCDLV